MLFGLTELNLPRLSLSLLLLLPLTTSTHGQEADSKEPVHIQTTPDPMALADVDRIARIEAKLRNSNAKLDVQEVPLVEVAQILSKQLEIPIRLHHRGLEDVGLSADVPVSFQLPEVSAHTLLRLLLKEFDLAYDIEAEGIVFTTPEEVEDKILARYYPVDGIFPTTYRDYDSLIHLISTVVEPERWDVGSGPSSIMPYRNGIILRQSLDVHQKIESLMTVLREARSLPSQNYPTQPLLASPEGVPARAIREQLREAKINREFDNEPLLKVAQHFQELTSVPFLVDRRALEDIGESPERTIDLTLQNVSVHHALHILSEQFELTWITFGEVVVITTPEEAENYLDVRVYPIRDLTWLGLNPDNREVSDLLDAGQAYFAPSFGGGYGQYGGLHQNFRVGSIPEIPGDSEYLIDVIQTNVEPDSWGNLGGPGSMMYFQAADCLVVSQSQHVHQQIASLLQSIRNQQTKIDGKELAEQVQQADQTALVRFYPVPRDRQGEPKFSRNELNALAGRIQRLFGQGTWDHDTHFIEVTQAVLVICHRRGIQRQIDRFWLHLPQDEANPTPGQTNDGGWNLPQGGFGNPASQDATPQTEPSKSTAPTEAGNTPDPNSGGVF